MPTRKSEHRRVLVWLTLLVVIIVSLAHFTLGSSFVLASQSPQAQVVAQEKLGKGMSESEKQEDERVASNIPLVTAVITLIAAVISLFVVYSQLKKERQDKHRAEEALDVREREFQQILANRLEEFAIKVENISNLLVPEEQRSFIVNIVNLYFTEEPDKIIGYSRKLTKALEALEESKRIWPAILEGAAHILSDKCDRSDENVSDIAFEALLNICRRLENSGIVIEIYEKLIKGDVKPHVRTNAIIGFIAFCKEKSVPQEPETQERFAKFMLESMEYLENEDSLTQLDKKSVEYARAAAIADLRIFRETPHILNVLLPTAVDLTDKDPRNLLKFFGMLIENINLDAIDATLREEIYQHAENVWLKKSSQKYSEKLRAFIVNAIIKPLNPSRSRRIPTEENRLPLRNKVQFHLPDTIVGQCINATPGGFCADVDGILDGENFQTRKPSDPHLNITIQGKKYKIGIVEFSVLDHSGSKYAVKKQKVEILRGERYVETSSSLKTRTKLAGRIVDPNDDWCNLVADLSGEV